MSPRAMESPSALDLGLCNERGHGHEKPHTESREEPPLAKEERPHLAKNQYTSVLREADANSCIGNR